MFAKYEITTKEQTRLVEFSIISRVCKVRAPHAYYVLEKFPDEACMRLRQLTLKFVVDHPLRNIRNIAAMIIRYSQNLNSTYL